MTVLEVLLAQVDPANAALVAVVWWRLDRRLRELRNAVEVRSGYPIPYRGTDDDD